MSQIKIDYDDLERAERTASSVAKRMGEYADELNSGAYNKLNNYMGEMNGNVSSALSNISSKVSALFTEQSNFEEYSSGSMSISRLRQKCESIDQMSANYIDAVVNNFKEMNFKSNVFLDTIDAIDCWLTEKLNKYDWLRNLKDGFCGLMEKGRDFLEDIKYWYQYKGGDNLVKGIGKALLTAGIAIASIAAIVVSAPVTTVLAAVAAVATVVGGVIAVVNSAVDLANEFRAYSAHDTDPGFAKRLHDEDTIQDTIRGETTENIKMWDGIANGIDAVDKICTLVSLGSDLKDLGGKMLKWGGGSGSLLSKTGSFFGKVKNEGKGLWNLAKQSGFKNSLKGSFKFLKGNLLSNLKSAYLDGSSAEAGLKTAKNWMSDAKDLISGEFSIGDKFLNITAFSGADPDDDVLVADLKGAASDVWKEGLKPAFDAITAGKGINISIPRNEMPSIKLNFNLGF